MKKAGCQVCGGFGDYTIVATRYDRERKAVMRTWEVEHRAGDVHVYETTNLPLDHERHEVIECS